MKVSIVGRLMRAKEEWRGVRFNRRDVRVLLAALEHLPFGRYRDEVERVYETRIDCNVEPGEARRFQGAA